MKKQYVDIYLFDSGSLQLCMAKCVQIENKGDYTKNKSPEPNKTPKYYNKQEYFAWFKFTEIEEVDKDIIKNFTYLDYDDFFVSRRSPFKIFNNKVVFSLNELQEQQRTIWFIRDKISSDLTHEIHSYSEGLISGGNVDKTFTVLPDDPIVWISDLHFSNVHHAFKCTETEYQIGLSIYVGF